MPGSGLPFFGRAGRRKRPVKRADGPSACPGNSLHERTSVGGTTPSGHAASRKVHPRAERRRFPASSAIPRLFGPLDRVTREGTHRRPPVRGGRSHELRSTARGAADAANRPAFRTPLRGEIGSKKTDAPWSRNKHGARTHVWTSNPVI